MDFNDVLRKFILLSKLNESECLDYHSLIRVSIFEVKRKLKSGIDVQMYDDILCELCAVIAYYRYNVLANTQNADINIADLKVSVNSSKEISSARLYKNEMIASCSHLLKDENFLFGAM